MMRYKHVNGFKVPKRAYSLTRGENGVMSDWLDKERDKMIATLLYRKGTLIGWCAVVRVYWWIFPTKRFKISTYVDESLRGRGLGKKLLTRTLELVDTIEPEARILYGTPDDHDYFNRTYKRLISQRKLKPVRFWCLE